MNFVNFQQGGHRQSGGGGGGGGGKAPSFGRFAPPHHGRFAPEALYSTWANEGLV